MAGESSSKLSHPRGLPSDFDVDEIIQALGTHNLSPRARFGHEKPQTEQEYAFVFGIQETHLGPADSFKLPNYICHRSDRLSHRGGGTAIFVRSSLQASRCLFFNTSTFENTTVRIELGNNTHLTLSRAFTSLRGIILTRRSLRYYSQRQSQGHAFGDFNAHHPCVWNQGTQTLMETLCTTGQCHALEIMAPTAPTYYKPVAHALFLILLLLKI
ncbi:RNA-directed DNA polymerase from mobile element jockey [Trichonephila clavipes]|nr:RNA-directed DNA polymerase from mobile element jockey [Trichonephila clavipes]